MKLETTVTHITNELNAKLTKLFNLFSHRLDFRKSSQQSQLGDHSPKPSPLSNSATPVSLPQGVEDLPTAGTENNGSLNSQESSPMGGELLGDLPSLGGPGVRGTALPPLGWNR